MDYNFLYKHIDFNGELNEKYFIRTDDGYRLSPFFIYKLASNAKEYFKQKILSMDSDPNNAKYTTWVTKEVVDYAATGKNKAPYADSFRFIDEKWAEYQDAHPDEFDYNERIDSNDELSECVSKHFTPEMSCSLQDAVQGYLCANDILKQYGKGTDNYDQLPKLSYRMSKAEFKDKHAAFKANLRMKIGIPEDVELTVKTTKSSHQMKRFTKANSVINSTDAFEEYMEEFKTSVLDFA